MRYLYCSLFSLFFFISCGTIGHVQFYDFNEPKAEVEKELREVIEGSEYSLPTCRLSLDGIYDGDHWQYQSKLSYKEMRRIRKRFETEILSKIKYPYNKD